MVRHMKRFLRLLAVTALLAPLSANATVGTAMPSGHTGRVGGITTGSGPVMTGRVNVYAIWYGASGSHFPASTTKDIVEYFISNWGASYSYGVLRNYTGSNGRVAPQLGLAGSVTSPTYIGAKLTDANVQTIVRNAIQINGLPADSNGIYVVFMGPGISFNDTVGSLCGSICGYHYAMNVNGVDIKYVLDGSGNCSNCQDVYEPNNDTWADVSVNTLAHELAETVTDPDINAWGSGATEDEVGDKCNFNITNRHNDPNGVPVTAKVGMRYYCIQQLWSPLANGSCSTGYAPPAAVIWQQTSNGAIGAWEMQDQSTVAAYLYYTNIPLGQTALAVGDFSNGLDPQVLLNDSSGNVSMWTLHNDNTTADPQIMFRNIGSNWKIPGTGDINGDGFSDVLFSDPQGSGDVQLFLMQGTTVVGWQDLGSHLPWIPVATADFDGDGKADIFWVDNADQLYSIWLTGAVDNDDGTLHFAYSPAANMSASNLGHPVHGILGVADFNADSRADVMYFPSNWASLGGGDGILTADYILWPFEQINNWVANSILPDYPAFQGAVDVNHDGTSDFYMQTSAGIQFFTMGDWRDWPQPVYGPILNSSTLAAEQFAVIGAGSTFSDAGWQVVGTGTFKEN